MFFCRELFNSYHDKQLTSDVCVGKKKIVESKLKPFS